MAHLERPHFAFPFRLTSDGTSVVQVEQDTLEHIHSCEHVIIRCPIGFRDERPDFGWPFPEFVNIPVETEDLKAALTELEPRGRARVEEWADEVDASIRHISVDVEVDTNA